MPDMDLRQTSDLIAVHVMEWRPVPINRWLPEGGGRGDEPSQWLYIHPKYGEQTISMCQWNPDRNIEDALRVVERMIALGYRVDMRWLLSNLWDVIFEKWPDPLRISKADPSLPKAICLAALRIMGVEVPDHA